MAYSFQGSIAFGLVYIPIKLMPAVRSHDVGFNLLDKKTMTRVRYQKVAEGDSERILKAGDVVKGYEYDDGKYVIFEDGDFEKIKTKKDKTITIEQFADLAEIDPVYYERAYYVVPTGGEKAYALLVAAMEAESKVGIAKTVLGNRETLIALRAKDGRLLLNTLYFAAEVQKNPAERADGAPAEKELKLAKAIIAGMSEPFHPETYRDEYQERVRAAIESKIAGKEIVRPKEPGARPVVDLMDALQKSLRAAPKRASSAPSARQAAPARKTAAAREEPAVKSSRPTKSRSGAAKKKK